MEIWEAAYIAGFLLKKSFLKYKKRLASLLALLSTLCMVETAGRAFPCFRHGTDYILNL
jgi:hypothetical protein